MDIMIPILRLTSTLLAIASSEDSAILEQKSIHKPPYMIFGNGVTLKDNMMKCPKGYPVCNVIHKRFWFSPKVIQMCRCRDNTECPSEWVTHDKHTIYLNNRAQLKYCGEIGNTKECNEDEDALIIQLQQDGNNTVKITKSQCFCPKYRYFEIKHSTATYNSNGKKIIRQFYKCKELDICSSGDFCGYITTNHYETYHRCKCPYHHMCIMKDRKIKRISEALYDGDAYFGWCIQSS